MPQVHGSRVNWALVKKTYLESRDLSLRGLGDMFPISISRLMKVSANEGWGDEKKRIWDEAEKEAIVEAEGSVKDLIKRHGDLAKFAQSKAVKKLVSLTDEDLTEAGAIRLLAEGLKAERELYPKQMKIEGLGTITLKEFPEELIDAFIEVFERKISGKSTPRITDSPK